MLNGGQYRLIDHDMTLDTIKLVTEQLNLMFSDRSIDKHTYEYLIPNVAKTRTPVCYFLPKIHKKTPIGHTFIGRPIVSNINGPCEKIGEFINFFT